MKLSLTPPPHEQHHGGKLLWDREVHSDRCFLVPITIRALQVSLEPVRTLGNRGVDVELDHLGTGMGQGPANRRHMGLVSRDVEIGRASCRERWCKYVWIS